MKTDPGLAPALFFGTIVVCPSLTKMKNPDGGIDQTPDEHAASEGVARHA